MAIDEAACSRPIPTPYDRRFMAAAIRLSRKHLGRTQTNPSVGAIIVRDESSGPYIIGRGVTEIGGRPHAETIALQEAGPLARGATLYVTLEPCSHYGRTPPCANAIINAGISKVVIAVTDPDERVSGRGVLMLRDAGITVETGILEAEAADLLSGYLSRVIKKRPEVLLKLALSENGMIGRHGSGQVAISNNVSRAQTHIMRAEHDAIMVGIGTVLADDPVLDCRLSGMEDRSPIRIIVDRQLRIPLDSKLVKSAARVPVWLVCDPNARKDQQEALVKAGCKVIPVPIVNSKIDLAPMLELLATYGIGSLMVEGGAQLAHSLLDAGFVDRLALFRGEIVLDNGIAVAGLEHYISNDFASSRSAQYLEDRFIEYKRKS